MNKQEHDDLALRLLAAHRMYVNPARFTANGSGFTTALRVILRLLLHTHQLTKRIEELEKRYEQR